MPTTRKPTEPAAAVTVAANKSDDDAGDAAAFRLLACSEELVLALAGRPEAPEALLRRLVTDSAGRLSALARLDLAQRPRVPLEAAEAVFMDLVAQLDGAEGPRLRSGLTALAERLARESGSARVLDRLAVYSLVYAPDRGLPFTVAALAGNAASAPETLIRLVAQSPRGAAGPAWTPVHERAYSDLLEALAHAQHVPQSVLYRVLRSNPGLSVRLALAENTTAPAAVLSALYKGPGGRALRGALARNPATPADVLRRLARPGELEFWFVLDLARNPATPADVVSALLASEFARTNYDFSVYARQRARTAAEPGAPA